MKDETQQSLGKASRLLESGRKTWAVGIGNSAGRDAYLAAMHAAQAFIFEKTGRVLKTHNGVQSEFAKLTRDDPHFDAATRSVLSRSYKLKEIADYDTASDVSLERAAVALDEAERFVARISEYLAASSAEGGCGGKG